MYCDSYEADDGHQMRMYFVKKNKVRYVKNITLFQQSLQTIAHFSFDRVSA